MFSQAFVSKKHKPNRTKLSILTQEAFEIRDTILVSIGKGDSFYPFKVSIDIRITVFSFIMVGITCQNALIQWMIINRNVDLILGIGFIPTTPC
jgi:hypothetical protein